ncbi:MAG: DUF523 domain-containing protein [Desulfomonile tiedjei]|nr:DUF523 domain-containing protein [Desulfomonile tiedjei]
MPGTVVISGCLAGLHVRYDSASRPHPALAELSARAILVPVCPEILGGLGIPRLRCRFFGGDGAAVLLGRAKVVDETGVDRTAAFLTGAEEVLRIVELVSPSLIVFKEGSPSCGLRRVDIAGTRQRGRGVVAARLKAYSIPMISEEDPLPDWLT